MEINNKSLPNENQLGEKTHKEKRSNEERTELVLGRNMPCSFAFKLGAYQARLYATTHGNENHQTSLSQSNKIQEHHEAHHRAMLLVNC